MGWKESKDIKQKEGESIEDYVAKVEQTVMLNLVALMERLRNAKDKDRNEFKEKQENRSHHREIQEEGFRDKNRRETRVQNDTDNAKEEIQDWLDMEKTKDKETEEWEQDETKKNKEQREGKKKERKKNK